MSGFDAVSVEVKTKEVTMEDLIARGLELREKKDNIYWELGDLAVMVTDEFGSRYLAEFSKGIGVPVSTIRRYRDVSKAYTIEERQQFVRVPWSAFRLVAAREDRMELLEKADDNSWSIEKLGVVAKNPEAEFSIVPPRPEMVYDKNCGKWGFMFPKDGENLCPNDGECEYKNA